MGCTSIKESDLPSQNLPGERIKAENNDGPEISASQIILEENKTRSLTKNKVPKVDPRRRTIDQSLEALTATILDRKQTPREKSDILKALSGHFIFNSMPETDKKALISKFKLYSLGPRQLIFTQGTPGNNFYIINSGLVQVIVNEIPKVTLQKGAYFGEIALLHDSLRTATIKTIQKSTLWVLSRDSFKSALKFVSDSKHEENKEFIEKISIFETLTQNQKQMILNLLVSQDFSAGQKIVTEGDPGDLLYIIKQGTVLCSINGIEVRHLNEGSFFGEQALLYKTIRTATITALNNVCVLSLKSDDLVSVLGSQLQSIIYKNSQKIAMERSEVLKFLTKDQINACVDVMKVKSFEKGQTIIKKKTPKSDQIYFVLKGSIKSRSDSVEVFGCIGDKEALGSDDVFKSDWVANTDTDIALLSQNLLQKSIGGPLSEIILKNEILSILKKVQIFKTLSVTKLESLIPLLEIFEYPDSNPIFNQGDTGDSFYIIKEGKVEVFKDRTSVRVINRHDFFGERAIFFNEARTATIISRGAVCWVLKKHDFLDVIDKKITKQIMNRIELQNDTVKIEDLQLIKLLGRGTFGNVILSENQKTKTKYALKAVSKHIIEEYDLYNSLYLEKNILMQIDHPFIVKLVKTFKDSSRLYFLMEYVQGMDLFDVIRAINDIDESTAAFYIGCLALILEHLHERCIIYRDLKPENIMVDLDGYAKLIDFGTAKIINNRTYTVVGTAHYMAPEVIKGTGYGLEIDYWSLGVILYEFLCNQVPFGESESDPYKIYTIALESKLKFPNHLKKTNCKNLIKKLLHKNPAMRGDYESLKKNSWFLGMDWDKLISKEIKPPYIPKITDFRKASEKNIQSDLSFDDFISSYDKKNKSGSLFKPKSSNDDNYADF